MGSAEEEFDRCTRMDEKTNPLPEQTINGLHVLQLKVTRAE